MLIIFFQILHKGKDLFEILSLLRIFWGDLKVLLFGSLAKKLLIEVKYPAETALYKSAIKKAAPKSGFYLRSITFLFVLVLTG